MNGTARNGIARVAYEGGILMLPSKSPYEREVLLETIDWYARQHGRVRLQWNEHEWLVRISARETIEPCSSCHDERPGLRFANNSGSHCQRCVT